jgi:membrane-associated protease RseP (regulator of RpoE activity)
MEQKPDYSRYKTLFSLLAAAVLIWGVLGTLDIRNIPFTGYFLSPDRVVTLVRENSPAAAAGVKVGDTVTRIDGIAVADFGSLVGQPRPAINSSGSVTVKRGAAEETLTLKYGSQPMVDLIANFGAATLTGLAFLILGLLVYLKNPTRLSTMFCSLSLLFAVVLFNTPYFASSVLRRLAGGTIFFLVAMLLAVVLEYCLSFPTVKKVIARRTWLRQAIYVVAGAFGVMVATIFITTPLMTQVRSMLLSLAFGLFFGGYILLSVIAVVHSYIKASTQERSASGLNLMLLGMLIGFGPLLLSILVHTISPHMGELPGERFYGISLLAIPIGLAMALMKLKPAPAEVPEVIKEKPKTRGATA